MDTKADRTILMVVFKPDVYFDWQCLRLRNQFGHSYQYSTPVFHSSTPFSHSSPVNSHTPIKVSPAYVSILQARSLALNMLQEPSLKHTKHVALAHVLLTVFDEAKTVRLVKTTCLGSAGLAYIIILMPTFFLQSL